jgi:hypothetical protein
VHDVVELRDGRVPHFGSGKAVLALDLGRKVTEHDLSLTPKLPFHSEVNTISTTDLLIRSLLLRPDQPAVLVQETFDAQVHDVVELRDGRVPHFGSGKAVLAPYYLDPILANSKGHELLADTLIAFLESEVCQVWDRGSGRGSTTGGLFAG